MNFFALTLILMEKSFLVKIMKTELEVKSENLEKEIGIVFFGVIGIRGLGNLPYQAYWWPAEGGAEEDVLDLDQLVFEDYE